MTDRICSIEGCGRKHRAGGLCSSCYAKKWRTRNPEASREYYEKNREKIIDQHREYYEKNREKILDQQREHNRRRIRLFGERFVMPDEDFRQFAIKLRDQRRASERAQAA